MAVDPRIDAANAADTHGRPALQLQRQVTTLEAKMQRIDAGATRPATVQDGPPDVDDGRDGTIVVDRVALRLYVKVDNVWRWTDLT